MATRFQYLLLGVAAILLILALAHQHDPVIDTIKKPWSKGSGASTGSASGRPSFKDIALKHGTDKVTDHHYWYMYEKYLEPLREKRVKMLEIGLGCDMSYGPGKSYYTWLEFFPNVDLYYIEYDAACAEKWKHKTDRATIFVGDQADRTFLRKFIEESGGNFDIIIDDGGHQMNQQLISFEELWGIVKPGAYYFIEDLHTSYIASYQGDPTTKDATKPTLMKYIYELIDDKMVDGNKISYSKNIRGIDCMREVCLITKMYEGELS
ncbi:S-adenosyl-L-methionine-dependent methyltransferase [Coniochaeta sp. 2T2.1]|nr:S-adenosyl-L-methionine-dependent methyltransferase [Coniochaeta sp. 2T2.1]